MAEEKHIHIEVAYALPEQQVIIPLQVKEGTTVLEAIELSGIREQFSGIDISAGNVGIFSNNRDVKGETKLREKDRVEIYRPLIADPKESRRKRAEKKKKTTETPKS